MEKPELNLEPHEEENLCPNCRLYSKADEPHSCPYNEALAGLPVTCLCCPNCTRECEKDI